MPKPAPDPKLAARLRSYMLARAEHEANPDDDTLAARRAAARPLRRMLGNRGFRQTRYLLQVHGMALVAQFEA